MILDEAFIQEHNIATRVRLELASYHNVVKQQFNPLIYSTDLLFKQ